MARCEPLEVWALDGGLYMKSSSRESFTISRNWLAQGGTIPQGPAWLSKPHNTGIE